MSKGSKIDYVQQCVHLGMTIFSDIFINIFIKNIDNAVNAIYMRTNNLMADFSYTESTTLFLLYNKQTIDTGSLINILYECLWIPIMASQQ